MSRKISQTLILRDNKWKVEVLDELINKGYFLSRGEAYRLGVSIILLSYGYLKHNEVRALCQQILGNMLKDIIETLDNKNINEIIIKLNSIHNRIKIMYKIADLNPIIHEIEILKISSEILKITEDLKALQKLEEFNTMLTSIREKLLEIVKKYNL